MSLEEHIAAEKSPGSPPSFSQEVLIIRTSPVNPTSFNVKVSLPVTPPIKEEPPSNEEQNDAVSELDDLGVDIGLELSHEELRTVRGSPRRVRSPRFRRDKVLAFRQVPSVKQLYEDGYLTPVSDPVFLPSRTLNRILCLFLSDIDKIQTDCRVVSVKSVRDEMSAENAASDLVSEVKTRQELPTLINLEVGQSWIAKSHQRQPWEMTIYTNCPVYDSENMEASYQLLCLCCQDMLELAERNLMDSVSMPPFASEFEFPEKEGAEVMLIAIRQYLDIEHPYMATLRRVIICGRNEAEIEPYRVATP